MKHTKKLVGLVLAVIMTLTLSIPAFAAQQGELTGGSITINDAVEGQTYTIYQLLYLESYNADNNTYAYKANSAWESWLKTQTNYLEFDASGYVTWKEGASAAEFAKLAQAKAETLETNEGTAVAESTTVTFSELKLGYYLVDSTLGTLCSLDTTNPNVTMEEKNEAPTNVKTVQEGADYGSTNDTEIGRQVNFKSTITAQAGAENYVFHDTMSAGLTFGGTVTVTKNGGTVDATNYTLKIKDQDPAPEDACTFEVVFTQAFCDSLQANEQIVIEYSATLNKNAVVALPGNPNESKLEYGETGKTTTTPPSTTTTYTWDMQVLKYANGDESDILPGAKFVLLNSAKTHVAEIEDGKLKAWVDITSPAGSFDFTAYKLTTDVNGHIDIAGLDSGTYYLRETDAPEGYNKLSDDITVTITGATPTGEAGALEYTKLIQKVENKSGSLLPSTGGIGTTIFYTAGGALAVVAIVLLVAKKRMKNRD